MLSEYGAYVYSLIHFQLFQIILLCEVLYTDDCEIRIKARGKFETRTIEMTIYSKLVQIILISYIYMDYQF